MWKHCSFVHFFSWNKNGRVSTMLSAFQSKHVGICLFGAHIAQTLVRLHAPRHVLCMHMKWCLMLSAFLRWAPNYSSTIPPSLPAAGSVEELWGLVQFSGRHPVYLAWHSSAAPRTGEPTTLPSLILSHVGPITSSDMWNMCVCALGDGVRRSMCTCVEVPPVPV